MSETTPSAPDQTAATAAQAPAGGLRGTLGVAGITLSVVAAAAPLTVMAGAVPLAIAVGNGPGVPSAYLCVGVVLLLFSAGYATMSRYLRNAGAFYAYITRGLGGPLGLGASFLAITSYTAIQSAVYGLLGASTGELVAGRFGGPDLPWWLWTALAWAVIAWLGYRRIDLSARVLSILLVAEVSVVLLLDGAVVLTGGARGLDAVPFTPSAFLGGAPAIALAFAVASFVGFEATAIYSDEARDPRRTVPRATYLAVVIIGSFYALSAWALVMAYGSGEVTAAAQAAPELLVGRAMETYVGAIWSDVTQVLLVTSLFASALAFHNAIARYTYALGRDGTLPAAYGRAHPVHGSPALGSVAQSVTAVAVVGAFVITGRDPVLHLFTWLSGVGALGIMTLMSLTCLAVVVFFRRHREYGERAWNVLVAPLAGFAGLVTFVLVLVRNFDTLIGGSMTLALVFEGLLAVSLLLGVAVALARRPRVEA